MISLLLLPWLFFTLAIAFPSYKPGIIERQSDSIYDIGPPPQDDYHAPHGYISPRSISNAVRSPCPALNTLANHGFLPRNGRDISRGQLKEAFINGFNVGLEATKVGIDNVFRICENTSGFLCTKIDLGMLRYPWTFEHDHSLSRQDYANFIFLYGVDRRNQSDHTIWGNLTAFTFQNQVDFNVTIFHMSLAILGGSSHMTLQQANQIRIQAEISSTTVDGLVLLATDSQVHELALIFGVMMDLSQVDYLSNPRVRADWWEYWFTYESFPLSLGWRPPKIHVDLPHVLSLSSRIRTDQVLTSTPVGFNTTYLRERFETTKGSTVTYTTIVTTTIAHAVVRSAMSAVGLAPTAPNPYATPLDMQSVNALSNRLLAYHSAIQLQLSLAPTPTPMPTIIWSNHTTSNI